MGICASVTGRMGSHSLSPLCYRTVCPRPLRTRHGALGWHILSSLSCTNRLMLYLRMPGCPAVHHGGRGGG